MTHPMDNDLQAKSSVAIAKNAGKARAMPVEVFVLATPN
jgi:hypothetical protein